MTNFTEKQYPERFVKPLVTPAQSGGWSVSAFTVSETDAQMSRLRHTFQGMDCHAVEAGEYIRLTDPDGETVMSSTPAECWDHQEALLASGKVLIAGLGIGLVLGTLLANPAVTEIVVVEKNKEVIDLVWHHYEANEKVSLVHQDIFDFEIDSSFDYCWFDIWNDISISNLRDMGTLIAKAIGAGARYGVWSLRALAAKPSYAVQEAFEDYITSGGDLYEYMVSIEDNMLEHMPVIYSYLDHDYISND